MILTFVTLSVKAQFTDGTTGLLHAPSADMYESGTFIITNNFLHQSQLASNEGRSQNYGWDYNTFGYGFGITFFSRLEIAYACTLFNGNWSKRQANYFHNQDRHFSAKVLLLKEGEIWKWTPSIAIGCSDPLTGAGTGDYTKSDTGTGTNGYFNRYYIVASKHFATEWGDIGAHLGYQYNKRKDLHYNAPCCGVSWKPVWLMNRWFFPDFIAEYDSRTVNLGFNASVWDDRFEAMFQWIDFRYVSFGLRFKLRLKGSE